MKLPEHILNSKLITDEQWEEYQELKTRNKLQAKMLTDIFNILYDEKLNKTGKLYRIHKIIIGSDEIK